MKTNPYPAHLGIIYFFHDPKAWESRKVQIVICQEILDEYQRVANELSSKYPSVDISHIIELVTIYGNFINTKGIDISICEDREDDKFIECAIAGKCKTIVSGDAHLLKLSVYKGIRIMKPLDFVDEYLQY